jgi:glycine/D-amino acid oxidase-like deaminating enzyme
MLSFWEKQSLLSTEIAIIGGGIAGLSVAASIKERWPDKDVTIFERSILPYGASTRNAGFACFGSLTEILSDVKIMGEEAARELIFNRWIGLQITRKRLTDDAIGFLPLGGYELLNQSDLSALDEMNRVNELVADFLPDYIQLSHDVSKIGLRERKQTALVSFESEGQLDTGLLMKSLEAYVLQLGVKIRTGAAIDRFEKAENGWRVRLEDSARGMLEMQANQLVVCTNAFARDLIPDLKLAPGRGQVMITEPIDGLKFRGNLHIDEGYYYLRNFGNRILFGGGRNLDFEREETNQIELNESIQSRLDSLLMELFDFNKTPKVDHRWSGIMAFGEYKTPIIQRTSEGLYIAVKMGGMGIALAGQVGEMLADLMSQE